MISVGVILTTYVLLAHAHITMVCTATNKADNGVTSFFLGTYKHGNSMTTTVGGKLHITPPSGITQEYSFSTTCSTGPVAASSTVDQVKSAFTQHSTYHVFGGVNNTACSKIKGTSNNINLIKSDSVISCFKPHPNPPDPTTDWALPYYRGNEKPYCLDPNQREIGVWWVAPVEGSLPGTYKLEVKNADVEMQPGRYPPCSIEISSNRFGMSQKGSPASMAVSTAKAGTACTTDIPDSALENTAMTKPTVCDGSLYSDVISGFNCPVVCASGYRAIGNLICDNGRWTTETFKCTNSPICGLPTSATKATNLDTDIIGVVQSETCGSITESGTSCMFTCANNKVGVGTIKCTDQNPVWQRGDDYVGCSDTCSKNPAPLMCATTADYNSCCS